MMRSYVSFEGLSDLLQGVMYYLRLQIIFFFLSAFDICKG
jgi:hypothetical protein